MRIDGVYWQTTINDLSIDGCQLDIINGEKLAITDNKALEIEIEGLSGESNIKLSAHICNVKAKIDGLSFGVKFDKVNKDEIIQLLYLSMSDVE